MRHQADTFRRAQEIDVPHHNHRIGDDRGDHAQQAIANRSCRRLVEQVGRVGDRAGDSNRATLLVVAVHHGQIEIEPSHARIDVETGYRQTEQLELDRSKILERQHHLEQRVPGGGTDRVEYLDQPLERHVRVAERRQIGFPDPREHPGERLIRVYFGTQHQRVDEHADHIVEFGLATSRVRGADRHIGAAGQSSQQDRQCRMHHHEQRRVVFARDPIQPRVPRRVHLERHSGAATAGHRRPRPVRRQVELFRRIRQCRTPISDLPAQEGIRVVLDAEHLPLPDRKIRVLHRKRRPGRLQTVGASGVRGHDVTGERAHREAVRRNVVHHDGENVLRRTDREHPGAQRHLGSHIEARVDKRANLIGQPILGHLDRGQIGCRPRRQERRPDGARRRPRDNGCGEIRVARGRR